VTKETFVLDAFFMLLRKPSVKLDDMNPQAHGISRTTGWRVLSNLRKAEIVHLSRREWSITQEAHEMFCSPCKHYKAWVEQAQRKHKEVSQLLRQRVR